MLKPRLRLRGVRERLALLGKGMSSIKYNMSDPACAGGQNTISVQLRCQGQLGATANKHSTFFE